MAANKLGKIIKTAKTPKSNKKIRKINLPIFKIVLSILSFILIVFITLPILCLILTQTSSISRFRGFLKMAVFNYNVWNVILLTYFAAFISTILSAIFGIPLAYILARYDFPGKKLIEGLIDIPAVIPHTVAGIALLSVLGSSGIIGKFSPMKFVDAFPGIVSAMLFVSFPIFLNNVREGFSKVDRRLEAVARTLGANHYKAFLSVTLPLSLRNIFAGAIVSWARAVSEFGAIVVIAYYPLVASTLIYDKYLSEGLNAAEPAAVLLIIVTIAIFTAIRWIFWRNDEKSEI